MLLGTCNFGSKQIMERTGPRTQRSTSRPLPTLSWRRILAIAWLIGVVDTDKNANTVTVQSLGVRSANWYDKMSIAHFATLLTLVLLSIQGRSKGRYNERQAHV